MRPPPKPGIGWTALALFASGLACAEPLDLRGAVARALESEAEYRSVRAELEAVREERAPARAGLLPTLSASDTHTENDAERTFADGSSDDPN
jgi:outer membrane protein TolC